MSYQDDDSEIIDYHMVLLPGTAAEVRGPLPENLGAGGYICAMGAAQTFGRFADKPFLTILKQALGVEILNLGMAGGGPKHFASRKIMLEAANRASLVILQVMSGRSVSNSYFENTAAGSLRPWTAPPGSKARHAELEYSQLYLQKGEDYVRAVLAETRQNYLDEYDLLLNKLKVPVVLFWFSTRDVDYTEIYTTEVDRPAGGFLGAFPQLVNGEMVDALRHKCGHFVKCISTRGLPQALRSCYTGQSVDLGIAPRYPGHNNYYPSPEMHEDAAAALLPAVQAMLQDQA